MNRPRRSLVVCGIQILVLALCVVIPPISAEEPQGEQQEDQDRLDAHLSTEELAVTRATQWVSCTPQFVGAFSNRIHVRCLTPAPGGIYYFAYPVTDPASAARYLSILSTAYVMGRDLLVLYDPADLGGTQIGCASSDCRLMRAVEAR
jgi:hypothetical protein